MKKIALIFSAFLTINGYAQSSSIKKMEKALETATNISDLKSLIDGDVASGICSLLTGKAICDLLIATPLNETEKEDLENIKSKIALEEFLVKKGISPDVFYKKLLEQRNSETLQNQLDFLKK